MSKINSVLIICVLSLVLALLPPLASAQEGLGEIYIHSTLSFDIPDFPNDTLRFFVSEIGAVSEEQYDISRIHHFENEQYRICISYLVPIHKCIAYTIDPDSQLLLVPSIDVTMHDYVIQCYNFYTKEFERYEPR